MSKFKVECFMVFDQKFRYYFPVKGVTSFQLFNLWVSLSRKGYYKIFDQIVIIDESFKERISDCYFDSLEAFIKAKC